MSSLSITRNLYTLPYNSIPSLHTHYFDASSFSFFPEWRLHKN